MHSIDLIPSDRFSKHDSQDFSEIEANLAILNFQACLEGFTRFRFESFDHGGPPLLQERSGLARMPRVLPAIFFQIENRHSPFWPVHRNAFACSTMSEPQSGQGPGETEEKRVGSSLEGGFEGLA